MTNGIGGVAPRGASELGRTVERIASAVRQDTRAADREQWLGQIGDTLREAQPVMEQLVGGAVDQVVLGEARDRIAAMLAEIEVIAGIIAGSRSGLAGALDGMASTVPIPIAPGANEDAIAAAQAVARLIAGNARPAISAQARIGPAAVMTVIGA